MSAGGQRWVNQQTVGQQTFCPLLWPHCEGRGDMSPLSFSFHHYYIYIAYRPNNNNHILPCNVAVIFFHNSNTTTHSNTTTPSHCGPSALRCVCWDPSLSPGQITGGMIHFCAGLMYLHCCSSKKLWRLLKSHGALTWFTLLCVHHPSSRTRTQARTRVKTHACLCNTGFFRDAKMVTQMNYCNSNELFRDVLLTDWGGPRPSQVST